MWQLNKLLVTKLCVVEIQSQLNSSQRLLSRKTFGNSDEVQASSKAMDVIEASPAAVEDDDDDLVNDPDWQSGLTPGGPLRTKVASTNIR